MTVYFIRAGAAGPVKIGFTRGTVAGRMATLQTVYPEKLLIIRELSGFRATETWLHRKFRQFRVMGEWFTLVEEMMTVIPPSESEIIETRKTEAMATREYCKASWLERRLDSAKTVLRKARLESGMQQAELALVLGISSSYLCRLERGHAEFPIEKVGSLPDDIRRPVAAAMLEKINEEIAEVQKWAY